MKIRKHQGINQKTGKLKKGFKYQGRLKSGLGRIVKVGAKKGGTGPGILKKPIEKIGRFTVDPNKDFSDKTLHFDDHVDIVKLPFNDCPRESRVTLHKIRDKEGVRVKKWKCKNGFEEYLTKNGIPCCRRIKINLRKGSKLKHPEVLKSKASRGFLKSIKKSKTISKDKKKELSQKMKIHMKEKKETAMKKVKAKAEKKRPKRKNNLTSKASPEKSITKAKALQAQILEDKILDKFK